MDKRYGEFRTCSLEKVHMLSVGKDHLFVCLCVCVSSPALEPSAALQWNDASKTRWGVTSPAVFGVSCSVFNPGRRDRGIRVSTAVTSFKPTPWWQTARSTCCITIRACLWTLHTLRCVTLTFGPWRIMFYLSSVRIQQVTVFVKRPSWGGQSDRQDEGQSRSSLHHQTCSHWWKNFHID